MEVLAEITSEELATIAYDLYVFRLVTVSSRRNNVCFFFHRMAAKMFSLASCGEAHQQIEVLSSSSRLPRKVMLFYDIAITFGEEVEVIWARKFSIVSWLWFLVRDLH